MKKICLLLVLICCMIAVTNRVYAGNDSLKVVQTWAQSDNYGIKVGGQMLRGVINAASCPAELVRSIIVRSAEGDPFVGTFQGIGEGAAYTILRAGGGIIDVATSIVPEYKNDVYYNPNEPIIFWDKMK